MLQIPVHFTARSYQAEALTALDNGCKLSVWCWSRRAGKDLTGFAYAVKKMVEEPMNVVLIFPTKVQGKNAFWDNVENDGFKTIEHIPQSLVASYDNNNMRIRLINGSTFQVLGASEPDALRGANAKLYIFSEFVDIDSAAYDVVRPIVAVNGGQIIIQSTPKIDGISGATFKRMFDAALNNPTQFASLVTADQYLSEGTLEELRQEAILKNGNDFFFRQEFLCDWGQVSSTSYYGHVLQMLEKADKIGVYPYDPSRPAFTAWDLGTSDSTAIVFFQVVNKRPRIIDYYETHDIGYEPIVKFVMSKPYNIGWHFFPHDGAVRDQSDAIQRIEKLRSHGLINSSLLRREPIEDGIRRTVEMLRLSEFNEATTEDLRRKLMLYKRKFNTLTGDYMGPEHKTESHAADAVRYMYAAMEQEFNITTGEFLYSPDDAQDTYDSFDVGTPAMYRPR